MEKAKELSRGAVPEAVLREILKNIPSEDLMQQVLPHAAELMKKVNKDDAPAAQAAQIMKTLSKQGEGKKAGDPGNSIAITRAYFDSLLVEQRLMDPVTPDTSMELFGEKFSSPIMTAALSHLRNNTPGAEKPLVAYAKGAYDAGCVHWIGMGPDEEFAKVAETGARTIRIIKPYKDEEEILRQIRFAEEHGALAVGMDIDHWYKADGEIDVVLGEQMEPKSRGQIRKYMESTSLPYVIKGVLSVRDAVACKEIGAAAIVVSHHNGRLNYAVPPLQVLPAIKEAVGDSLKIFVDCGIASGADAYKALALGADAVCVGTHLIPYTREGADAVADRLREMTAQLRGYMANTGVKDLNSFDPSVIHHKQTV